MEVIVVISLSYERVRGTQSALLLGLAVGEPDELAGVLGFVT